MVYSLSQMLVYRLTREKYKENLSGKGAAYRGGRWNTAGIEIIYCATNRSLAMAEVAVHVTAATMPTRYWMLTVDIPEDSEVVTATELPTNWNSFPYLDSTKHIGDQLIYENLYLAMKVPSAVVQDEWNVLINPFHKNFKKVRIVKSEPFHFDRRLF